MPDVHGRRFGSTVLHHPVQDPTLWKSSWSSDFEDLHALCYGMGTWRKRQHPKTRSATSQASVRTKCSFVGAYVPQCRLGDRPLAYDLSEFKRFVNDDRKLEQAAIADWMIIPEQQTDFTNVSLAPPLPCTSFI